VNKKIKIKTISHAFTFFARKQKNVKQIIKIERNTIITTKLSENILPYSSSLIKLDDLK
jgi:hypothetical protein